MSAPGPGPSAMIAQTVDWCESNCNASSNCPSPESATEKRLAILQVAAKSAEQWAHTNAGFITASLCLQVVMLAMLVRLRRRRPIQRAGPGFMASLLFGCMVGHLASLIDGATPSGVLCRCRLSIIYLFIYGLLAPLVGKLVSLVSHARNHHMVENTNAWDQLAQRVSLSLLGFQVLMNTIFLSVSAPQPWREDRFQTICTARLTEHSFHIVQAVLIFILVVGAFIMIVWLRITTVEAISAGLKELLLSAMTVTFGSLGLFALMTASTADISWASAVVPVRFLIIIGVSWLHIGFQVLPPLVSAAREVLSKRFKKGRRRRKGVDSEAMHKRVAIQQKQLVLLEAEVVERQRALQENLLRLKLMTTPMMQSWAEVAVTPAADRGTDARNSSSSNLVKELQWKRFFLRLFQNKQLVCWMDSSEQARDLPPERVIDLFEVKEVQHFLADMLEGGNSTSPGGIVRLHLSQGGRSQAKEKDGTIHLRFSSQSAPGSAISAGALQRNARRRSWRAEAQRATERTEQWLTTLRDMVREISEPDPPPSFHTVKVWVGTWNMGNAAPDAEQMRAWLGVEEGYNDVYAIGLQESSFKQEKHEGKKGPILAYMSEVMLGALGPDYAVVETRAMWEIRLIVIAHENTTPHIDVLDSAVVATGIGGVGGNKGGVGIALTVHATSLCFITAHLAAHQHMTKKRNQDALDIFKGMRSLAAGRMPSTRNVDPTISFDHTFFFGDLNYRLGAPLEQVCDAIEDEGGGPAMHAVDQLIEEKAGGRALVGFEETPPGFAPTFKRFKAGKAPVDPLAASTTASLSGVDLASATCPAKDGSGQYVVLPAGGDKCPVGRGMSRLSTFGAGLGSKGKAMKRKSIVSGVNLLSSLNVGSISEKAIKAGDNRPKSPSTSSDISHLTSKGPVPTDLLAQIRTVGQVQSRAPLLEEIRNSAGSARNSARKLKHAAAPDAAPQRRASPSAGSSSPPTSPRGPSPRKTSSPSPLSTSDSLKALDRNEASMDSMMDSDGSDSSSDADDDEVAPMLSAKPSPRATFAPLPEDGGGGGGDPRAKLKRAGTAPVGLVADGFSSRATSGLGPSARYSDSARDEVEDDSYEEVQKARCRALGHNPQRIPSWCDRVLWRSYPQCQCRQTGYRSEPAVDTSDHLPVCATFAVRVMLEADADTSRKGDRHQWELSIDSVEIEMPLAALEEDDQIATRTSTPELLVEFSGTFIRTGCTTPRLPSQLIAQADDVAAAGASPASASGKKAEGGTLTAQFGRTIVLPLTDVCHKQGPQRIVLSHLVMQVVAVFGARRVILGATVLDTESALRESSCAHTRKLVNCGVSTGGSLTVGLWLRDLAERHKEPPKPPKHDTSDRATASGFEKAQSRFRAQTKGMWSSDRKGALLRKALGGGMGAMAEEGAAPEPDPEAALQPEDFRLGEFRGGEAEAEIAVPTPKRRWGKLLQFAKNPNAFNKPFSAKCGLLTPTSCRSERSSVRLDNDAGSARRSDQISIHEARRSDQVSIHEASEPSPQRSFDKGSARTQIGSARVHGGSASNLATTAL